MHGKTLLFIRRTHLYLSVFFAPLLLLFVITGWAQTMGFDHSTALMQKLSRVHTAQYFPTSGTGDRKPVFTTTPGLGGRGSEGDGGQEHGPTPGFGGDRGVGDGDHGQDRGQDRGKNNGVKRLTWPTKWLVAAMSVALIVSISLGLVLAFTMVRNRVPVWIALILGVVTPVALLALAHT